MNLLREYGNGKDYVKSNKYKKDKVPYQYAIKYNWKRNAQKYNNYF